MSEPAQLARSAREQLATALNALQSDGDVPAELEELAEPIAEAMGILHRIERSSGIEPAGPEAVLGLVRQALNQIQTISSDHPLLETVMDAVAMSLSKAHALSRMAKAVVPHRPVLDVINSPTAAEPPEADSASAPQSTPRPEGDGSLSAVQAATAPRDVRTEEQWTELAPIPAQIVQSVEETFARSSFKEAESWQAAPEHQAKTVESSSSVQAPPSEERRFSPLVQSASPRPTPEGALRTAASSASSKPFPFAGEEHARRIPSAERPAHFGSTRPVDSSEPPSQVVAAASPVESVLRNAPRGKIAEFDVALGTQSASNLWDGIDGQDVIEHGGIFVATYKAPKIGSSVRLHVHLPGDCEFQALASIVWTREPGGAGDTEPGFGARFTQISPEARQLVRRFARNREPLFYDSL
ncbi:PilZ domain-containing protein [Chondromyces crocatus]|uniref:PilZ domain-containing protein n=1 Tax=Chondromyces crocatus TaxID=52 RepID=A0A0K1E7S8_CHOCO|nr:PilZ domain-containing protein [Chondromyces crocatus]AKT36613.1 uncharacterized protein CMC5_007330 [Chondromyces crocatus]